MIRYLCARLSRWAVAVIAAGAAATPAWACGPYRVVFYEYGSMYMLNPAGSGSGVDKDVLDEVARRTGCKFVPSVASRVATWAYMTRGVADITVSSIRTPERERMAAFAIYLKGSVTLYVRAELAATIDSLHSFVSQGAWTLAVVKGFSYGPVLDAVVEDLRKRGRVVEYADAKVATRIIGLGRADALLAFPLAWEPLFKAERLEDRVAAVATPGVPPAEAGLALSRERVSERDIQRMTQAVADMRADGTLTRILERYGAPEIARRALP